MIKSPRYEQISFPDDRAPSIRDEIRQKTVTSLAKQMDDEIRHTADALLPPGWTMEDIAERFSVDPAKEGDTRDVIRFDGRVVLEIGPIRSETREENGSYIMTVTRDIKRYR